MNIRSPLTCCLFFLAWIAVPTGLSAVAQAQDPRDATGGWDLAMDPHKVLGSSSCEKCHTNELAVWRNTPHSETFFTLHRKTEAQQIASRLGIDSFKTDSNCIQCHYTMQHQSTGLNAVEGVSCESCHGAASDWIAIHNDYGGPGVTKASESRDHARQRLLQSVRNGMKNPLNLYLVAQSCYRCHTVPDEELVNVGGHNAGSLDFELVSWSQGTLRHNFLRTDGLSNAKESIEKIRIMFIAGMIADLEFSVRATARATEKASFGVTSAKRAARALKRLQSLNAKVDLPEIARVIEVMQATKLKLNNQAELDVAADQIKRLGLQFAGNTDGSTLAAIDPFLPPEDRWK